MEDSKKLNKHSLKVFDILSSDFPEVLKYSSRFPSDEGDFFLKIEIDAPNKNVENGIYFDTEDNMLTVGFDCFHYHTHFFTESDFRIDLLKTVDVIKNIMCSELFVAKSYRKDEHICSFLLEKEKLNLNKIKNHQWIKSDCNKVQIISWKGDFDSEIILSDNGLEAN